MNVAQSIYTREKGFGYNYHYDIELMRLKCYPEDVYHGVSANPNALDYNPNPPVFACKFCCTPGHQQILALANEDGKIALQDTSKSTKNQSEEPLEGVQAHNNAIFDIAWMPQELKLVTASGDRSAVLWDVGANNITQIQKFQGINGSIKSVVFRPEDKSVFATGGRDGTIMIWDTRANHNGQPKPDNSIFDAHLLKNKKDKVSQSVTALTFQNDETLISCSAGDGIIKVWDLRKNYTIHKKENLAKYTMSYGGKSTTYNGFTSMMINPTGSTLYVSCIDKKIYAYNILTYINNPVAEYYGHGSHDRVFTFYVKACLSPDGKYLISGSNDETAYIWSTSKPGLPVVKLSEHRDEVTCIAWCHDEETKIVTCSDDCRHRIWRVRPDTDEEDLNVDGYAEPYQKPADVILNKLSINSSPQSCTSSSQEYKPILTPVPENVASSPSRPNDESRASRQLIFSPSTRVELSSPSRSCCSSSNYESDDALIFSPTSGLPNFVVDGTAPHLLANSPQKKTKENVNWLIAMRKKRKADSSDNTESPSEKKSKTPTRRTPGTTPGRSRGRTPNRTPTRTPKRKAKSQRELKFKKDDKSKTRASSIITDFINNLNLDSRNRNDKSTE